MEGAFAVDDRAFELVVAAGQRVEHHARVVHERAHRAFLGVEDRHQLAGAFDERFELGEGRVDLFSAAVDALRERLLPDREVASGLRVERRQDVVERHLRLDVPVCELVAVGEVRAALALGDQLHVGLAEQRLLANDRVHVGAHRRVLAGDFDRRVRAPVAAEVQRDHVSDVDAADAHVRLFGERERARERDAEAVALGLQRQRAAEGLPQEHQQPEAADHEQDDHEDVAQRGSALLHLSPPLPRRCLRLSPMRCSIGRDRRSSSCGRRWRCGQRPLARTAARPAPRTGRRRRGGVSACARGSRGGFRREPLAYAFGLRRRLEQADQELHGFIHRGDRFEDRQDFAVEVHEAAAERAVGVGRADDAVEVVVAPVEEEQEAGLARGRGCRRAR